MNGSLQFENPCPNCGKNNKPGLKFCNYCGTILRQYDVVCPNCGKNNKPGLKFCNYCGINLVQQKTDKIEITQTIKAPRYVFMCICLIPLLVAIIMFAFAGSIEHLIIMSFVGLFFLGFYILLEFIYIGRLAKQRTFSISDNLIKFSVPKKPSFEISWNEFVRLEIKEWKDPWYTGTTFSPRKFYQDLYFYTDNGKYRLCTIDMNWDFKKKTCIRIISLLQQYCTKFNKQFSYTKE